MTSPRRQRWLEPQARLMNAGVSFPSSSVHEFYSYGGSGGFGSPFIAPPWGFASNFSSSSSSYSSHVSASQVTESVVKKEPPVVKKKEKTPIEIYNEEAFTDKPKAEMGRLSKLEQDFLDNPDNKDIENIKEFKNLAKRAEEARKKGDYITEAKWDRRVQEWLKKECKMKFYLNPEARKAYAYNSIEHHYPEVTEKLLAKGYSIDDVFYYHKPSSEYYVKSEYEKKFIEDNIITRTSLLVLSNNQPKTYIESRPVGSNHVSTQLSSITAEEYDRIAFK